MKMAWTRRNYITKAFSKLGMASYVYDLTTDQLNDAAKDLDAMIAGFNANGIRIGWPMSSDPDNIDLDVDTNSPDYAHEAIYLGLAIRISSDYGKQLSPLNAQLADSAYSNLLNQTLFKTPEMQFPNTMPKGAGSKPWRYQNGNPFVRPPSGSIEAGSDNKLIFE